MVESRPWRADGQCNLVLFQRFVLFTGEQKRLAFAFGDFPRPAGNTAYADGHANIDSLCRLEGGFDVKSGKEGVSGMLDLHLKAIASENVPGVGGIAVKRQGFLKRRKPLTARSSTRPDDVAGDDACERGCPGHLPGADNQI